MSTLKLNTVVSIDPNKLQLVKGNREINSVQLGKIKAAMERENLLHIVPILINKDMEIIDGQHRVGAAIELGCKEVPCLVVQANVHDAPKINALNKNWTLLNYAKYWRSQGKRAYTEYLDFVQQTGIVPSTAIEMLGGEYVKAQSNFKAGKFSMRNAAEAYHMVELMDDYGKVYPTFYRSRPFIRALWVVTRNSGYNHDRMMKALEGYILKRTVFSVDYTKQLQEAFNKGAKVANRVVFELKKGV